MSEDYYDPNFNSYAHGPGSRLDRNLLPSNPRLNRGSTVVKLYVKNIHPNLSEDGIRNVFLNFGNPLTVYKHPTDAHYTWGLVSYASHREAELAIRELNKTPPFFFQVQFARTAAEKERIRKQRENDEMLSKVLESEPFPRHSERIPFASFSRGIGRGRGIPLPRHMGVARCRPGRFEQLAFHNGDTYAAGDLGYFSPYVPGVFDERNRMIMEQRMNRTFSSVTGKRWVSMGRGYFPASERPLLEPKYDIEIKRYGKDEKRMLAQSVEHMYELWYEHGQKEGETGKSGNCTYCHRMAFKYCQQCFAWYCTESCQLNDWPRHRTVCIPKLSASDAAKSPGSQLNRGPAQVPDGKQSHEPRLERSDVHQATGQNIDGSSDSFAHGDSMINSHCNKEEHSKTNFKENCFKKNYHDGLNRNADCDKSRSDHFNAQLSDTKKGRYRSNNSSIEGRVVATERKRSSVNERLSFARQKENGRNISLASDSTTSHQIQQESEVVSPSVDSGQVKPMGENMPNIAAVSQDRLCAKGDAVNAVTPDDSVVSAINKMGSLNMSDSNGAGCNKSDKLPKDRFTKVTITVTGGPMEYWVQLVDSEPILGQVMRVLYALPESFPCKLEVGALCAAFYEGLWYRGKVTSVKPELKVLYIDYGNEEVRTPDQLKGMPSSLMGIPAMGLRIKLAEGTSEEYSMLKVDETLSLKPVGETSNGAVLCHVEGQLYKPAPAPPEKKLLHTNSNTPMKYTPDKCPLPRPKQKLELVEEHIHRSAVEGLKVGMRGGGEFKEQLIGGDCCLTIVYPELKEKYAKLAQELEELKKACESVPVDKKYRPIIGDMVLALTAPGSAEDGGTWNRARVLSVSNSGFCHVNFCDIGCTGTVKVVKKLSQDLASIPEFAARCSVISPTESKGKLWSAENRHFLFTVTGVDETQKAVTCVLQSTTKEEICKAVLKRWVPAVDDEELKCVEVKNNASVVLQVFFDQKSLHIRPASSSAKDMFYQLNQDVGRHCIEASELDHLPAKNELVACKFVEDGNYYRAKVLDVSEDNVKVVYVDYGNLDCATRDRLKPLSDSLKRIPCMTVKVGLKDALDKPLTLDANDFLSDLVGREVEMKLILTGSRKDEVQLILPDGSSLNDTLNTMLEPQWKRAMAAGKDPRECGTFMGDDIKYLELPVGQTIDFIVLHKLDSVTVMGCDVNREIMMYVHTSMKDEINRYCNSTLEKVYVPRYSELCFARFQDGVWYRAMYLEDDTPRDKNVIFLDFGNLAYVEKENIRKMIKDYVETPAVAVMCSLQGLENADETLKNRVCELIQVNKVYKARVVSCPDPGRYVIEFPHVTEALIKKTLLPSEN